jgi:hypothetical protein
MATRTGGQGRAVGTTVFDPSVEVYSAYAGPTLSTHAGALAINAAYRLGYVAIDDDTPAGAAADYGSAVAHSLTGSVGMAPGSLPVGWTIGAGYARTDNDGEFDSQFEGAYVRGDVVVPVGPTLALTAGIGYEDFEGQPARLCPRRQRRSRPRSQRTADIGPDAAPPPDLPAQRHHLRCRDHLAAVVAHRAAGARGPPLRRHDRRRLAVAPVQRP